MAGVGINIQRLVAALLAIAGAGMACAAPLDPWNTLYDGWDGVTCDYFNVGARIKWKSRQGDWVDATGKPRGDAPFAEANVPSIGRGQSIDWNITTLVHGWVRGTYPNAGIVLAPVKGRFTDTAAFASREAAKPEMRPQLAVRFADGRDIQIDARADAELNCSTVTSLGQNPELKVAGARFAALQFDLQSLPPGEITRATLRLWAPEQQYGNNTVGVFRLEAPLQPRPGAPEAGIAAKFVADQGIDKDPDVVFATGFESTLWRKDWSHISLSSNADRIDRDDALQFAPLFGHALRVKIPKTYNQGVDMGYDFKDKTGAEPEEIYFRYYLRFASDWDPGGEGGKLPGPSGTYGKAGWGGRKADPKEGWSMRGGFRGTLSADNPFHGRIPVNTYAYHAGGEDFWGEPWDWMRDGLGLLERNRWYCIEQYFRVNAIGQRDGIMRAWIDGRLAFEQKDVRVRDVASLKIERIWMNVYFGGTAPAPRDLRVFIDNVVIAKRYIGPAGTR